MNQFQSGSISSWKLGCFSLLNIFSFLRKQATSGTSAATYKLLNHFWRKYSFRWMRRSAEEESRAFWKLRFQTFWAEGQRTFISIILRLSKKFMAAIKMEKKSRRKTKEAWTDFEVESGRPLEMTSLPQSCSSVGRAFSKGPSLMQLYWRGFKSCCGIRW